MREQERVLEQQADPPVVGRHLHARGGVGEHAVADPYDAVIGPDRPGDHV